MNQADYLLRTAQAETGYLEKSYSAYKARPACLYEKTAGAGSDNVTKYGRDLCDWIPEAGDTYGIDYQWCDQFVDWCMVKTFGKPEAKRLLGGWSAYTPTSAELYKRRGQWHNTPKRGAQIFFKNDVRICHTGLVLAFDDTRVWTIEGNTSSVTGVVANGGCVREKCYDRDNPRIAGYGWPAYKEDMPEEWDGMDIRTFIEHLYTDELLRAATDDEVTAWEKDVQTHGRTPEDLQRIFRDSPEGRTAWIWMLYGYYLQRNPQPDELKAWTTAMEKGESREGVMRDIANSPEALTLRA